MLQPEKTPNHTGRYRRALLDHLFGEDGYDVYSLGVDAEFAKQNEIESLIESMKTEKVFTLINQTDDNLTCLLVHDQESQGWMRALEEKGFKVVGSPKTPKRLTTLTRHVYLAVIRDFEQGDEEIPVVYVEPDAFSKYKLGDKVPFFTDPVDRSVVARKRLNSDHVAMSLDGGSVMSKEMLEEMIDIGARFIEKHLDNPHDTVINRKYDNAFSGQIRLIGPDGQIKGDTLISDRKSMARALESIGVELPECGYVDVITTDDNLKHEVSWSKGQYLIFEPHGLKRGSDAQEEAAHQYTDQQYLCWMHNWLFTSNDLLIWLHDYINHIVDKLRDGQIPSYFESVGKLEDPTSSIERFQYTALMYEKYGLGIRSSISLLNRIMNGAIKQLNKDRKDPKFPIPCSMYAHVATDSWLRACGRDPSDWPTGDGETPRGYIWYDKLTDRMVYNDLDFIEDYERHGGFDLDDAVKYFARTWRGVKVWVAVRSPNTYGEYSIRRYLPRTFAPVWQLGDGDPIEFPELPHDRLPFKGEFRVDYEHHDLNFNMSLGTVDFDKDYVAGRMLNASRFFGLFGRYVNLDMVYHGTFKSPQTEQLAPLEEVVDASTQNPSAEARSLIAKDVDQRAREIESLSMSDDDIFIDEELWKRRGDSRRRPRTTVTWFTNLNDNGRTINTNAVVDIRTFAQSAVNEIPGIIHKLGDRQRHAARKLIEVAYACMAQRGYLKQKPGEKPAHFHGRINDLLVEALYHQVQAPHIIHDVMMAIGSESYSNMRNRTQYNDTLLFYRSNLLGGISMFDLWLDSLAYYRIKEHHEDPEGWIDDFHCHSCSNTSVIFDPVRKQELAYEPCQHTAGELETSTDSDDE